MNKTCKTMSSIQKRQMKNISRMGNDVVNGTNKTSTFLGKNLKTKKRKIDSDIDSKFFNIVANRKSGQQNEVAKIADVNLSNSSSVINVGSKLNGKLKSSSRYTNSSRNKVKLSIDELAKYIAARRLQSIKNSQTIEKNVDKKTSFEMDSNIDGVVYKENFKLSPPKHIRRNKKNILDEVLSETSDTIENIVRRSNRTRKATKHYEAGNTMAHKENCVDNNVAIKYILDSSTSAGISKLRRNTSLKQCSPTKKKKSGNQSVLKIKSRKNMTQRITKENSKENDSPLCLEYVETGQQTQNIFPITQPSNEYILRNYFYFLQNKQLSRVIWCRKGLQFDKMTENNYMRVAPGPTSFDAGFQSGFIEILAGKYKPRDVSNNYSLVFTVMEGEALFEVHDSYNFASRYTIVYVPIGAFYRIQNQSQTEKLIIQYVNVNSPKLQQ